MSSSSDLAIAAQALAQALLAATSNPADGIRLLASLADFNPQSMSGEDAIGVAIDDMRQSCGDLFRRSAVVALARAASSYEPSSYNDAENVRNQVTALLDAEITIAGDQGEDDTFEALRALRVAVIEDLTARGATLAPIVTYKTPSPMPALTLANKIYRDASRADQLVTQADPVSPNFMPVSFQALAE